MTEERHTTEAAAAARLPALVYKGEVIHERHEMLSLTDMWRAAGSDPGKQPAKWRDLPSSREFAAHVASVILRKSEDEVFRVLRGGRQPGTWAHWQVAMAYAKYLSPEFHAWCNDEVRARMQGDAPTALPGEIVELIRRTDGIARMLSGKVTSMQARVEALEEKNVVPALDFGGTVTAHQMIEMAGISARDRQRGTAQMVTRRMLSFCAERQVACFRTPAEVNPSRPFRFPQAIASDWLLGAGRGIERIRGQVERMKSKKGGPLGGQGALRLV